MLLTQLAIPNIESMIGLQMISFKKLHEFIERIKQEAPQTLRNHATFNIPLKFTFLDVSQKAIVGGNPYIGKLNSQFIRTRFTEINKSSVSNIR